MILDQIDCLSFVVSIKVTSALFLIAAHLHVKSGCSARRFPSTVSRSMDRADPRPTN